MAEPVAESSGWGGEVAFVGGVFTQKSQFNVDDDNRITPDLNSSGKRVQDPNVFPLARLDFTLNDLQTQFFAGNSRENVTKGQIAMELGVVHGFEQVGKLTIAVFPKLPFSGETWKDPFLTGQERQTTNEKAGGDESSLNMPVTIPLTCNRYRKKGIQS